MTHAPRTDATDKAARPRYERRHYVIYHDGRRSPMMGHQSALIYARVLGGQVFEAKPNPWLVWLREKLLPRANVK